MQSRTKLVLLFAAGPVALVLALGVYFGWNSRLSSLPLLASKAPERPFRSGERHRYQLSLDTRVSAEAGTVVQYKLAGEWLVDVVAADPSGTRLLVSVSEPKLESELAAGDQQGRLAQAQAEFQKPLLVVLDADGRVTGMREQDAMELQASSMMRAVAATMQVATAHPVDADSWESEEQDGVGTYIARYAKQGERRVEKTKLRYTQLAKNGNMDVAASGQMELIESRGTFELFERGLVRKLSYEERTRLSGGMLKGLSAVSSYQLSHLKTEPIPAESPAQQTSALLAQSAPPTFERTKQGTYSIEADRARVGGRSFSDLMSELEALPTDQNSDTEEMRQQRRKAFIGMAALMRLHPAAVHEALQRIQAGDTRATTLWDALASAATPEAQAALIDVIRMERWSVGQRNSQMIGLSMADSPTPKTVEFLKSMVGDPTQGQQALFGMGTAVHNLMDEAPARADQLLADLSGRLQTATTQNEQLDLLSALGNTAHPDARPALDTYLASDDSLLRQRAVWALRQQPAPDVDRVLAGLMTNDPVADVRAKAAQAAASRNPSQALVEGVLGMLQREDNETAKNAAQFALRRFEGMEPTLAQQLAQRTGP